MTWRDRSGESRLCAELCVCDLCLSGERQPLFVCIVSLAVKIDQVAMLGREMEEIVWYYFSSVCSSKRTVAQHLGSPFGHVFSRYYLESKVFLHA